MPLNDVKQDSLTKSVTDNDRKELDNTGVLIMAFLPGAKKEDIKMYKDMDKFNSLLVIGEFNGTKLNYEVLEEKFIELMAKWQQR